MLSVFFQLDIFVVKNNDVHSFYYFYFIDLVMVVWKIRIKKAMSTNRSLMRKLTFYETRNFS